MRRETTENGECMMKICPKCETGNEFDDNYCGLCGFKFNAFGSSLGMTQKELKANDIQINLAIVYLKMAKYDAALDIIDKVLEKEPGNLQALSLRDRFQKVRASTEK